MQGGLKEDWRQVRKNLPSSLWSLLYQQGGNEMQAGIRELVQSKGA